VSLGTLILVAGPSGAGKETLIRLARRQLGEDARFRFVRRVITRPGDAGAEDHEPAGGEDFARRKAEGAFALSWDAHGLSYGVPRAMEDDLAAGRVVVVNVSRAIVPETVSRYPNSRLVIVTAPPETLAARLAARGREPQAELGARLGRPELATPAGIRPVVISNDRGPQEGAEALIAILLQCAPAPPSPLPTAAALAGEAILTIEKTT